ncbi:MAG: CRTAC1 family protein, partial [Phaeodactylibacter sp.]|nr:CRTAC1 family protein [Phaeodactylibacter sp.]
MRPIFTIVLLLVLQSTLISQVSFTNRNDLLNDNYYSGVAIGIADMNGDFLDDIVHLDDARILNIQYQQPNADFATLTYGNVSNSNQWSMCVADVDNNGYNDVLSGGYYDGVKVVMANSNATNYTLTLMPGNDLFIQGSNFADINNDGWVDAFACHDDGESRIFGNNGDGSFYNADSWINMATVPSSDNSGNYGSVWTDFDNDGDLDLYIAKCRQGVNDPSDPRRINALFVNDGNNNFTEAAATYGLKIGPQSWTADFGDYDNDGDMDCFITNHDVASMLLEQDESGYFNDVTDQANIDVNGLPIQGIMRDFNNDGFLDIIVAGSVQHLFLNNGDKTFTEVDGLFDSKDMESFAVGDLNHDGALDVYAGYAQIYTNPSNIPDKIWMNDNLNSDNNFVTFNLVGTTSNRNAIGARLELYGNWGVQIREIRAGESYGIMNSFQAHFGLGTTTGIDSLVIRWPSGIVQTIEDLMANQFITIVEEECVSPNNVVTVDGNTTICSGESVTLSAPAGYTYQWSNGANSQSIVVEEAGSYLVTIFDGPNCSSTSAAIQVNVNPEETPTVEIEGDLRFCAGGTVILTASQAASYQWSNGETSQTIMVTEAGDYVVTTEGLCDFFSSEPVTVEVLEADAPVTMDVVLPNPGPATLE